MREPLGGSRTPEAEPQDPEAGSSQAMMVNYGKIPACGCVFIAAGSNIL